MPPVPAPAPRLLSVRNPPPGAHDAVPPRPCPRRAGRFWRPLLLAGCGGEDDAFAPSCPSTAILRDAADLSRYRGSGRDLTDRVLAGRITGLNGTCKRDGTAIVDTTVSVGLELTRGPAAPGRQVDVAYFVAVTDGDRILDRQVVPAARRVPTQHRPAQPGRATRWTCALPVSAKKSAAAYKVWVGFVLTPIEAPGQPAARR